ncbi:MAG: BON domain-containing protein, partial [Pyrinomonadaceae bacterium]
GQSSDTNADLAAQQPAPVPQTTIIQQPAPQQQPPVIIQQPAPVQQAPVIINPAPAGVATSVSRDAAIQTEIDKRIADDPSLSGLGITATVLDGKVTLVGIVKSEGLKNQIERTVRRIKGVTNVDNQITVMP